MSDNIVINLDGKEITVNRDIMVKALGFYLANAPGWLQEKDQKSAAPQVVTVNDIKPGETFSYGGIKWVKLDDAYGGALVLAVNTQFESIFATNANNDWATSSLRKYLNATTKALFRAAPLAGIVKEDLIEFERDLTTDDGKTEYGTCRDFISLYTCDEYRKYRKFIPECGEWHWTITADSPTCLFHVRVVESDGTLSNGGFCYSSNGVRPLCVLKPGTIIKKVES